MSEETPKIEEIKIEPIKGEPALVVVGTPAEKIVEVIPKPVKPKTKPKRTVKSTIKEVASVPKKVVEKVVDVVAPKEEEPIEVEDEEPDYSYFTDKTCWLCKREGKNGAHIDLRAGNGNFSLFMCGDCQRRFRKG